MQEPSGIEARSGDVVLMVGTTKGGFLLRSSGRRDAWEMEGPHFPGSEMYALALDQRGGRRTLWAAPSNPFWGTTLHRSDDLGSQAAFYAAGVSRERMLDQMDEIDSLNRESDGFRILKGVEADILADGRLDYDAELLDRFDYVIASIHSRFKMDGDAMTARVLRAMDDPHMTILAHPTGRLLLSRKPYALDLDAVFEKALERGVAIEINCDPHRMDLDWRHAKRARDLGVTIAIGPDAHSPQSLDWIDAGVAMARKAWLGSGNVLNTRDAEGVIEFAYRRRS